MLPVPAAPSPRGWLLHGRGAHIVAESEPHAAPALWKWPAALLLLASLAKSGAGDLPPCLRRSDGLATNKNTKQTFSFRLSRLFFHLAFCTVLPASC